MIKRTVIGKSSIRSVDGSVKKANRIAKIIRNKSLDFAIDQMKHQDGRFPKVFLKSLNSLKANVIARHPDVDTKKFVLVINLGRDTFMRRHSARARGRINIIMKPKSNIFFSLEEKLNG